MKRWTALKAAIEAAVADPDITVKSLGTMVSAGESPPNSSLIASVQQVVHSMWPGVMVIPTIIAGQ